MRIENRELFVTLWDEEKQAAVVALLIGWEGDDPSTMLPVVAYNYGVRVVDTRWKLSTDKLRADEKATFWQEPS